MWGCGWRLKKKLKELKKLTLSWQRSLSYTNQSTDLQNKSMDWFLYDKDLRQDALAVFTEKYGCNGTNFVATVNSTNLKTEIEIDIIKKQIIGIQIYFVIKKIFLLFSGKRVCSQLNEIRRIKVLLQFSKIVEDNQKFNQNPRKIRFERACL